MSDSKGNKDIIQEALDILRGDSQDVRVLVQRPGRPANFWYGSGELTGLGALGDDATITLTNVRADNDGPVIPGCILFDVNDILEIRAI